MPSHDALHGAGRRHGILDAAVLSRCLDGIDRCGLADAFRRFESTRKPRSSQVHSARDPTPGFGSTAMMPGLLHWSTNATSETDSAAALEISPSALRVRKCARPEVSASDLLSHVGVGAGVLAVVFVFFARG